MSTEKWIDLRGDNNKLYGRLNQETLEVEIRLHQREVVFDLIATAQQRFPVVVSHRLLPRKKRADETQSTPRVK